MNGRDASVCMMRVRNEERWIARSLARTFRVCRAVVIWDDGSTDDTERRARAYVSEAVGDAARTNGCPGDESGRARAQPGGLHSGSIPRSGLRRSWRMELTPGALVHFGYLHGDDRRRKYEWYNRVDPDDEFEGRYAHIVGMPDQHAPGPLQVTSWTDM